MADEANFRTPQLLYPYVFVRPVSHPRLVRLMYRVLLISTAPDHGSTSRGGDCMRTVREIASDFDGSRAQFPDYEIEVRSVLRKDGERMIERDRERIANFIRKRTIGRDCVIVSHTQAGLAETAKTLTECFPYPEKPILLVGSGIDGVFARERGLRNLFRAIFLAPFGRTGSLHDRSRPSRAVPGASDRGTRWSGD